MEIKITKKLLKDYKKTLMEIPILEYELKDMQTSDSGINNSTIYDYREGYAKPQSVIGFDWPEYEKRKKALDFKKEAVKAVKEWIEAIEDGQTRCIFRMRYIDGMEWVKIAAKTRYGGKHDYLRKCIRDAYLKEKGIK